MIKKRLWSLLLAVSMLLTLLPSASAAVTFDPLATGPVHYTVKGSSRTGTLREAWNAAVAGGGGTLSLREDITAQGGSLGTGAGFRGGALVVPSGCQITLDLAGRKLDRALTAPGADGSVLVVEGELILQDSSSAARGAVMGGSSTTAGGGITVARGGVLRMQGGSVAGNASQTAGAGGIDNRGTVEMTGGKVTGNRGGGLRQGGTLSVSGAANISGNTDTANVYLPKNRTLTVSGTLSASARLGVTTEDVPTLYGSVPAAAGSVSEASLGKIVADQSTLYKTAFEGGKVVVRTLAEPAPAAAPSQQSTYQMNQPAQAPQNTQNTSQAGGENEIPATDVEVSFYLNYNTSGGAPSKITVTTGKTYGQPKVGLYPSDPTRPGYLFDGWYTAASDGQGVKVTKSTVVSNANAHSLYAHWKAAQVAVTFDARGGTVSPTQKLVSIGEAYGSLPVPVLEGRTFEGWYTAPTGGQEITAASIVQQQYQHTLYAVWSASSIPWLVSFHHLDENGNDRTFIDATDASGKITLPTPAACGFTTPEGKEFAGWSTSWNGLDLTPAGAEMTFTENSNLYAVWWDRGQQGEDTEEPKGNEFIVTYLLDGTIEGETVNEYREENKAFQLMENPLQKSGYHFVGWLNESKVYKVGESFTMPSKDVTFTAVWEPGEVSTCIVYFEANYEGAPAVNPDRKEVTIGQKYGELPTVTREGYTFDGWYTEAAVDQGVLITAEDTVRFSSDHVLYAHWTNEGQTKKYTIKLKGNGGTVNGKSEDEFYRDEGEAYSDGLVVPIRKGYTFMGWYDGNKVVGASTPATKDTTLEAHWTEGEAEGEGYLITFDANDDSGRQFQLRTEADGWMDLPECRFDPPASDIVFDVWTLDPQNEYRMSNRFRFKNDATIYARWKHPGDTVADKPATQSTKNLSEKQEAAEQAVESKASQATTMSRAASYAALQPRDTVQITVTFDANYTDAPAVDPTSKTVTVGAEYGELPSSPTRENYTFAGWYTEQDGGTVITATTTVEKTENHTLYAIWSTDEQKKLTFKNGGGSGGDYVLWSDANGNLKMPDPEKLGMSAPTDQVFDKWSFKMGNVESEEEQQKSKDEDVTFTADTTITALWKTESVDPPKETVTITFKASDAADADAKYVEVTKDEEYTLPNYTDTELRFEAPEGKGFAGWVIDLDGSQTIKKAGEKHAFSQSTYVYAAWKTEYTVDFYKNESETDDTAYQSVAYLEGETYVSKWGNDPDREDFTFDGWFEAKTGNDKVEGTTEVGATTPKSLYAHWTPNAKTYKVTFDLGYTGAPAPTEKTYREDEKYSSQWDTPQREGYQFLGWIVRTDSGTRTIQDDEPVNANSPKTLTANWKKDEIYTITFDPNGGTAGGTSDPSYMAPMQTGPNGTLNLPECRFVPPEGQEFDTWATIQDGVTKRISGIEVFFKDTTVYAIWKDKKISRVEVTFDKGNSVDPQPTRVMMEVGTKYKDDEYFPTDPTWTGFIFDGWSFTQNSVGNKGVETGELLTEDSIVKNQNHSVYAVWKAAENMTVTFTNGGGTGADYTFETDQAGNLILPEPKAVGIDAPDGKEFDEWEITTGTRTTERKKAGETFTLTTDTTLKAIWKDKTTEPTTYTVIFNENYDGAEEPKSYSYNSGESFSLHKYTPTRSDGNYIFNGWFDSPEGGNLVSDETAITAGRTVYAQWSAAYKITFNANNGSGTMEPVLVAVGRAYTMPAVGFGFPANATRFIGWAIGSTSGERAAVGETRIFTGNTTLYALWEMSSNSGGSSGGGMDAYHPTRPSGGGSSGSDKDDKDDKDDTQTTAQVILNASAGGGGSISPSGQVRVERGSDQTFTITAGEGYVISDVLVDNSSVGAVSRYTFDNVQRAHTIQANFVASAAGTVQPADAANTASGSTGTADYLSCSQGADCPIAFYSDLSANAWYHDGVHYCLDSGLMTGTTASIFDPSARLTRAMLAQILYNQAGRPSVSGGTSFGDVVSGAWYENAVSYAASVGMVAGYENGNFGPNDPITREQLVVVLWRHAGSPASGVSVPLSDFFNTRAFADEAMRWAYGRGIISGKDNGLLDPGGQATRVEVAQMLKSYFA